MGVGVTVVSSTSFGVPPTLGHQNCLLSYPRPILWGLGLWGVGFYEESGMVP